MLYHGTNVLFDSFDFNKAKPFKDFGRGFYLTTNYKQAENWARSKGRNNAEAYIYCYELAEEYKNKLEVLELLYYDKTWLDFIADSRLLGKETNYDLIYDRMADNTYLALSDSIVRYRRGEVEAHEVIKLISWKTKAADQYCFKTEKAISCLKLSKIIHKKKLQNEQWIVEKG